MNKKVLIVILVIIAAVGLIVFLVSRERYDNDSYHEDEEYYEYFALYGEEGFRKKETEITKRFMHETGVIIATGGGVIKNPNNLSLLKQNGIIVLLNRPVDQLATDGRPISMSCSLEKLAKERLPIYNAWKDYSVDCSSPDTSADKIIAAIKK